MRALIRLLALAAALWPAGAAQAQNYPEKSVRVVVGFTAGGPTDVIARIVAQKLSESWGQQFYIENVPGAGSNTASGMVAKTPPDGYTLLVISTGFVVNPSLYAKVPYDAVKDFAPITLVAASPNVVSVNPSVPARNVQELIALIRANPGKYSFAGPGIGSTPHLSGELFRIRFGLDLVHVPFPGAAPAVGAAIAGHVPIVFSAVPPAISAIQSGQIRALAVTAPKRIPALPDVPTMAESGIADQEADTLTGIIAPAGTPREIVDKLYREIKRVVALPDVQEKLATVGFEPVVNTPDQFAARIKVELTKWEKVVHDAKIRVE
ncbi:MAG TPA: tripartite tricarboxylate transporter substrate binding protein [Xanthobacteraceae bacterium]|jgi:tripartite-type tricarboxylate transporter receptor subunit TctC|nr:tripartite tricarboxylate transporter substrate binding protein [Xanthobacteraceae bacterium]